MANCSIAIRSSSACSGSNSKVSERSRSRRDLDLRDFAHLELVGDGGNRAVLRFQDAEADRRIVGQDRARPAARPERADRGQRQHLRLQRQDRARAPRDCRRSNPPGVATSTPSQASSGKATRPLTEDLDLRGLPRLAKQGDFVDRGVRETFRRDTVVACICSGATRIAFAPAMRSASRSSRQSFIRKPTVPRFIPNTGFGMPCVQHSVQRLQHEAVAAERDQGLGLFRARPRYSGAEASPRPPCATSVCDDSRPILRLARSVVPSPPPSLAASALKHALLSLPEHRHFARPRHCPVVGRGREWPVSAPDAAALASPHAEAGWRRNEGARRTSGGALPRRAGGRTTCSRR